MVWRGKDITRHVVAPRVIVLRSSFVEVNRAKGTNALRSKKFPLLSPLFQQLDVARGHSPFLSPRIASYKPICFREFLALIITDLCPSLRGGCWLNDIRVPNVSICRRLTFDFRLRGTGPRFCTRERDKFREFAGKFRLISLILVVQVLVICWI